MTQDKKTLGLTDQNNKIMSLIMANNLFGDEISAAKFAMSVAIDRGTRQGSVSRANTKWNQGSFDPNGEIKQLINILYPDCETPYKLIEHFINEGLQIIGSELSESGTLYIDKFIND